jgi:hypothetical protein
MQKSVNPTIGADLKSTSRMLFVGNYDRGIVVANIDDAFQGKTTGALARKCIEVAPRAVHYLGEGDAAILYAPLSDEYRDYYRSLYGRNPMTFAPRQQYADMNQPLSLLENILADSDLLERIAQEGRRHGWRITPFISHPLVHELGRRTGLPVSGMGADSVDAGNVTILNDKAAFQHVCKTLDILVPKSLHIQGWDNIIAAAKEIYSRDGRVMLRRARAAGGLGNCEASKTLLDACGAKTLEEYFEKQLLPREEWEREIVLVEPVLNVLMSPTTLFKIEDGKVRFIADSCRILRNNASVGGLIPSTASGVPRKLLDRMVNYSYRYSGHVRHLGGDGYFDIDWGVIEKDDGVVDIVAFESNYRFTGNNHPIAIRQRLRPENAAGLVSLSNDALKVSQDITLADVLAYLEDAGHPWCHSRGEGIVVTIPPAGGSMGYVAIAETLEDAEAMGKAMETFSRRTFGK